MIQNHHIDMINYWSIALLENLGIQKPNERQIQETEQAIKRIMAAYLNTNQTQAHHQ